MEEKSQVVSAVLTSTADDVEVVNLIGSVTFSVAYSHCLTTGIGFTIGGCGQVRQRSCSFSRSQERYTMGS